MSRARVLSLLLLVSVLAQTALLPLVQVFAADAKPPAPARSVQSPPAQANPISGPPLQLGTVPPTTPLPPAAPSSPVHQGAPLAFEPNVGQTDKAVRFLVHAPGSTVFFTPSEITLIASCDHWH